MFQEYYCKGINVNAKKNKNMNITYSTIGVTFFKIEELTKHSV